MAAQPPKFLLTFLGAGHVSPFLAGDNPQAMALKKSTVDFWDHYLKGDTQALDQLRTDANVPGSTTLEEQTGGASPTRTPASTNATSRPGG